MQYAIGKASRALREDVDSYKIKQGYLFENDLSNDSAVVGFDLQQVDSA